MSKKRIKFRLSSQDVYNMPENVRGVYAFWYSEKDICLYVGIGASVRERLRHHLRGSHNKKLDQWIKAFPEHIEICYTPSDLDHERLKIFEKRLIKYWRSETNENPSRNTP